MTDLVDDLIGVVGAEHVLDPLPEYTTDWTGRFAGHSAAVVLPANDREVREVVRVCRRHRAALVPQGGNTGLVGGSVPLQGEVVVSLRRLDTVVATPGGQLVAGAGATLAAVHRAAESVGWAYGVDFASRERATIGGTIATNAGGLHVFRHGNTRAQVIGVNAVLGNGEMVTRLVSLTRDNSGYHLPSLLCGSEGTLGIVTAARLRLVPLPTHRITALLAFGTAGDAVDAAQLAHRHLRSAEAIELMLADGVELVCAAQGLAAPFPARHAAYLLVEAADTVDPSAEMAAALAYLDGVEASMVTVEPADRLALWQYREKHTDSINTVGVPHKLDVAVPGEALSRFIESVPAVVSEAAPGAQTWLWGHAAEGNVHVNVTGVGVDDERADDAVLHYVVHLGGSISAEHGIGTAKRRWLPLVLTQVEIEAYRAIKRALDPDGILNPNVLLPPS